MKVFSYYILMIGIFVSSLVFAADLALAPEDVLIIQSPAGGYHLYIKKRDDIQSVLITESSQDPTKRSAVYAYRSATYNAINGDEKRLLNGKFIPAEKKLYSLIDSTSQADTPIGEAFHIWIPFVIEYGYSWSRLERIQLLDGTFLNLRTFEKPYADYRGAFFDNPFELHLTQQAVKKKAVAKEKKQYSPKTLEYFEALAQNTKGCFLKAGSAADIAPFIAKDLQAETARHLDLLFVIDATASMKDDIDQLQLDLLPMVKKNLSKFDSFRIALVLYKDYEEDFLVKKIHAFSDSFAHFEKALQQIVVKGGKDIPEAVYEGLHIGLQENWRARKSVKKKIVLIGDAPPHAIPRGAITRDIVYDLAQKKSVEVLAVILPHEKTH